MRIMEQFGLRWKETHIPYSWRYDLPGWVYKKWNHKWLLVKEGRRKWRRQAKQFRTVAKTLVLCIRRQTRRYEDANLKRFLWKMAVYILTIMIGVYLILK